MDWTTILIILAVAVIYFLFKRAGQISKKLALEHLRSGALVIDVRSPGEFRSRHLPKAINMPLEQIEATLPGKVREKDQVLLLHCQSGMRSGMATGKLKRMGYTNAFNLGSFARAAGILDAASGK